MSGNADKQGTNNAFETTSSENPEELRAVLGEDDSSVRTLSSTAPLGDLTRFRLSQDYMGGIQTEKVLSTVPVRKPHKQEFIRASQNLRFETMVYQWEEDGRTLLVDPKVFAEFNGGLRPTRLVGTVNRQGVFFFWPIMLPGPDGEWNSWHQSADAASAQAVERWVRVASNRSLGAYEQFIAKGELSDPEWPAQGLETLLEIAFKGAVIASRDHVVLRKLRGEL